MKTHTRIAALLAASFISCNISYAQDYSRFRDLQFKKEYDIEEVRTDIQTQQQLDTYKAQEEERMKKAFSPSSITGIQGNKPQQTIEQKNTQSSGQKGTLSMGPLEFIQKMKKEALEKTEQEKQKGCSEETFYIEEDEEDPDNMPEN